MLLLPFRNGKYKMPGYTAAVNLSPIQNSTMYNFYSQLKCDNPKLSVSSVHKTLRVFETLGVDSMNQHMRLFNNSHYKNTLHMTYVFFLAQFIYVKIIIRIHILCHSFQHKSNFILAMSWYLHKMPRVCTRCYNLICGLVSNSGLTGGTLSEVEFFFQKLYRASLSCKNWNNLSIGDLESQIFNCICLICSGVSVIIGRVQMYQD